jgi:hypothetical protein
MALREETRTIETSYVRPETYFAKCPPVARTI